MPVKTKGFQKAIKDMKARSRAFSGGKPYEEASEIASKSIKKNVESGGRPKWTKRKGHYSHPILDHTGLMRDSAEHSALKWQHGSKWHVMKITGPDYGLVHQYKGVKTKVGSSVKHIVRKYVLFQKSEVNSMIKAFRKAFLQ